MQAATPLSTVSPNRPLPRADGKSPSPAKPGMGVTPTRSPGCTAGTPQHGMSPGMNLGMLQAGECMCPTCQYYKACYMYHQEAHSPEMAMANYQMYQYGYYPFGAGCSPMSAHSQPNGMSHSMPNSHNSGSQPRAFSPMPTQMPAMVPQFTLPTQSAENSASVAPSVSTQPRQGGNPVVEQFQQSLGNLAKLACTANGRTMLQGVMRLAHLDKNQTIFDELIADADTVMLDSHGCHVMRSLIEVIDEHQLAKLMECLHSKLILNMCTLSQYTRKILQTLFERHRNTNLQNVVDIMSTNAGYLAATQQGCISLMRVFERCTAEQKHSLAQPLLKQLADLACDPFGNYVVQCILEHSEPLAATRYALDCFNGEFLRLACNKFGSNVCEKIIRVGNANLRRLILDELIFNPAALQQACNDGFGNFVIQTLVDTCNSPSELKKVCDRLRPCIAASPYGHKIDAKIRTKRFPQQGAPAVQIPVEAGAKRPMVAPVAF